MAPPANDGLIKKIKTEFKSLLGIALYFWILFTLFAFHKAILTNDRNIGVQLGVALLNSKIMAKVVFLGERTPLSRKFLEKPLIFTILAKSLIFSIVLFIFRIFEEILIGLWGGRTIHEILIEDHPKISNSNGFVFIAMACTIIFVALIPFFAYLEIEEALGEETLRALLFRKKLKDFRKERSFRAAPVTLLKGADAEASENQVDSPGLWYATDAGEVVGPITAKECQMAFRDGVIDGATLVCLTEEDGWKPLREHLSIV
jgi:hypothetical protein